MAYIRPLERAPTPGVLVVGGGIAGIQAALEVAAAGLPVTLVEEGPSLGGLMAQLDKTFPTNDCAMCILSPRMLEIARHPAIEILTLTKVLQVQGQAGDFQALLSHRPRYVEIDRCSGCGECTRVCPQHLPDPFNAGLSQTKAVNVPFPQAIPQAAYIAPEACRVFHGKKCGACLKVCPAEAINLAQAPVATVRGFGAVILALGARPAPASNFPGYEHPDVVTSLEFERLLSATGPHGGKLKRLSDQAAPARIAFIQCVGSRDLQQGAAHCSSLCCMASLKEALVAGELGEDVASTIFYMDLRTPGKGYDRYLEQARARGVQLVRSRVTGVTGQPDGGVTVHYTDTGGRPRTEPFDLAVLALGLRPAPGLADWARRLGLALNPAGFLQSDALVPEAAVREGFYLCGPAREPMDIAESVASAGAAAAAASQLLTTCRRRLPQPAAPPAPGAAALEPPRIGVFICRCGANIAKTIEVEKLAARVRHLPDVVHVEDQVFACSVEATRRLAAIIQSRGLTRVVVAACTPRTHEGVFRQVLAAAGLNPGFFTLANIREQCAWVPQADVAAAQEKALRLVAMAVRRARVLPPIQLQAFPVVPRALVLGGGVAGMSAALNLADQGFHTYLVEREPHLGGLARQLYFTLEGPDPQAFLQELQAGVYQHPNIEVLTRTELLRSTGHVGQFRTAIRRETPAGDQERELRHGVILVATGGQALEPWGRYGYGEDPRIVTQPELEARIAAVDPELSAVRRLVMIQCVGSREPERPYCSRLCCQEALKNALLLKARYLALEIVVLYRDIRAYGFREAYYQQAKEKGVAFIPFDPARPPRVAAPRRRPLAVWVADELLGQEVALPADLVVLSTGIAPAAGSETVARQLKLAQTQEGFFQEVHPKLRPMDAVSEGVFLCGLAHYPRTLGETATQARAAAARAAGVLFQTELISGEITAAITPGKCRRCLTCLAICPFGAVEAADGHLRVSPELCRGCGTCAAECPAAAIVMSRGTEAELSAQIAEALAS